MNKYNYAKVVILALSAILTPLFLNALHAENTNRLKAQFKEIKKTPLGYYGLYTITNVGQHDIDDVVLHLYLKNKHRGTLSSIAITDATPGLLWLKVGESTVQGVPLDGRNEARVLLETNPGDGVFVIEVKKMTFMNP